MRIEPALFDEGTLPAKLSAYQQGVIEERRQLAMLLTRMSEPLDALTQRCQQPDQQPELSLLLKTAQQRLAAVLSALQNDARYLTEMIEEWQRELDQICSTAGISTQVHSQLHGEELCLESEAALTLTRMIREAATNIIRHSHASCARLDIRLDRKRINVQVSDNGRGRVGLIVHGRGIQGMQRRALALDGHFGMGDGEPGLWLRMSLPLSASPSLRQSPEQVNKLKS